MRLRFVKIKNIYNTYPVVGAVTVFFIAFIAFCAFYIYGTGDTLLDDHFFHFHYAYLLRTQGWDAVKNFDWIFMNGISAPDARYQVSLFNYFLIPFTFIKNQMLGLKIADAFLASLFFGIIYYVLRKIRIKQSVLFLLLISTSLFFLMRVLSGRAYVIAIALVFLEFYLAGAKKYKWLFVVTMLHIMWHQSTFFMPIVVVIVTEAARYLNVHRFFYKNFFAGILGVFAGMLIYSGFPMNIFHLGMNLFNISHSNDQGTPVGVEMVQRDFMHSFVSSFELFTLAALFGAGIAVYYYINLRNQQKPKQISDEKRDITFLYTFFIFLIVMVSGSLIISGRFFDYYIPAAAFLLAVATTIVFADKKVTVADKMGKMFVVLLYFFLIMLCAGALLTLKEKYAKFDQEGSAKVAEWIAQRADEGDKVYLDNWSYFTVLFFYNDKVKYSMGLEPHDALVYAPELYWKWFNFHRNAYYCDEARDCTEEAKRTFNTANKMPGDKRHDFFKEDARKVTESIKNDFGARFIVSHSQSFSNLLHNNDELFKDSIKITNDKNKFLMEVFELKDNE